MIAALIICAILGFIAFIAVINEATELVLAILLIIIATNMTIGIHLGNLPKIAETEINLLRQTLVDNGLATYTPTVVEKKFELLQKVVAEKEGN